MANSTTSALYDSQVPWKQRPHFTFTYFLCIQMATHDIFNYFICNKGYFIAMNLSFTLVKCH